MNAEALKRFETIANRYLHGSKVEQDLILSFFSDEEKESFLEGVGLYHLFTDEWYYKQAESAMAEQVWNELRAAL